MAIVDRNSGMTLAALLIAIAAPLPQSGLFLGDRAVAAWVDYAASAEREFYVPDALPKDTTLRISGEPRTYGISARLKTVFEQQLADASVEITQASSQDSVKALFTGNSDLAMVSRALSASEQSNGLISVPIAHQKIGVFIGRENPFDQSLTNDQFAQIYSGEITNWSELGGPDRPIRLLTRPANSDLVQSLTRYAIFASPESPVGKVVGNDIDTIVNQLGDDGIAYAVADQVIHRDDVQVLPLHDVYPDDPRYSFSQPINYVYQGPDASPKIQAFLGLSQRPEQVAAIEAGRLQALGSQVPSATSNDARTSEPLSPVNLTKGTRNSGDQISSETPILETAQDTELGSGPAGGTKSSQSQQGRGNGGWWLLLLILGIPLFGAWLLKMYKGVRQSSAGRLGTADAVANPLNNSDQSRLIMVPKDSERAYAYWELSEIDRQFLAAHPETELKLRVHDVTPDGQASHQYQELLCDRLEADCQVPIEQADRSYLAQLGFINASGDWMKMATSSPVYVPAVGQLEPVPLKTRQPHANTGIFDDMKQPSNDVPAKDRIHGIKDPRPVSRVAIPFTQGVSSVSASWINVIPHSSHQAEVTWHLSQAHLKQLEAIAPMSLTLRVYDAHTLPTNSEETPQPIDFSPNVESQAMTVDLPEGDRDYIAELGYYTPGHHWVRLVRSPQSHLPKSDQDGARVLIMPCDPYHLSLSNTPETRGPKAYVYWDISSESKAMTRAKGGNILVVRVYGHLKGDRSNHHNYRQLTESIIQDDDRDRVIALPEGDRYYRADVGYLTIQGKFLSLGKSDPILIPNASIREVQ